MNELLAVVYLRAVIALDHSPNELAAAVWDAQQETTNFAARYGYRIVARHQDVIDRAVEVPLPDPDSAFARLLADLRAGVAIVVLVPSKTWLSTTPQRQRQMAAMVAGHGGTLVMVDTSTALGIAPLVSGTTP